ncbi:MAG: peptidoglycan bridge formation glycyltransferase FemA/FemB family protein [Spirochaetales bacterium]|nr:peptidoglycan bridge formation glycyltransferase FemA/FemB family protein [Spirochaetales bacterium]
MNGFRLEASSLDGLPSCDNLLQSPYWAGLKQRFGSLALGFHIIGESSTVTSALTGRQTDRFPLLVLLRKLPVPGGASIGYVPHGPDIEPGVEERQVFLQGLAEELKPMLPSGCVFLRFDLPWRIDRPQERETLLDAPFRKAAVDIQVPDTVVVDLTGGEDEILSRMKPKTRYNIRLSGRKGVTVRIGDRGDLKLWYELAKETAERDRITLHAESYFAGLFEEGEQHTDVDVVPFFASVAGETVAAIIISICGSRCIYHFGASRSTGRNFMPTYALQWEAMKYAKAAGCGTYDLLGIPPSEDPRHPLHGLYRVKTGFGGEIVHRAGCWDYPVKPTAYGAYRIAEKARNVYFMKVRKRLLGLGRRAAGGTTA